MKSKLIADTGQKVWAIVFETGEEAAQGLLSFTREQKLAASQFTAIGAFQDVELGFFEMEHSHPTAGQKNGWIDSSLTATRRV